MHGLRAALADVLAEFRLADVPIAGPHEALVPVFARPGPGSGRLKRTDIGVTVLARGVGGAVAWRSPSSISPFGLCWARLFGARVAPDVKTSGCSRFGTNWRSSAAWLVDRSA